MRKFVLYLYSVLIFTLAGCGETIHQQLTTEFQRVVVSAPQDDVRAAARQVLESVYGRTESGQSKEFINAGPIFYTDQRTGRPGREICRLAVISQEGFVEVFAQVRREVKVDSSISSFANKYDSDGHTILSPAQTGEILPAERRDNWRYDGRSRSRENEILTQITNRFTTANK